MKIKLTKQEKNWILYDVGNSAFTLLAATILPIYFNYIAGKQGLSDVQYLAYWGYAVSIAPYLQHLQDRYLEPLQIQKAIKNQFLQLHLESGQLLQSHWDLQSTGWPFW